MTFKQAHESSIENGAARTPQKQRKNAVVSVNQGHNSTMQYRRFLMT
jgi:hypothetical protein